MLIILGDFNLPEIKWQKNQDFPEGSTSINFINFANDFGLHQVVEFPTLGNNYLDLIFCQHKECILNVVSSPPFSTSDHDSLTFEILCSWFSANTPIFSRNYKKASYVEINAFLGSSDRPMHRHRHRHRPIVAIFCHRPMADGTSKKRPMADVFVRFINIVCCTRNMHND